MKLEKNMLYQIIIIGAIVASIPFMLVFWQMVFISPIIILAGMILLVIIRKKEKIDDERALKISEKASEKTIIVFIFSSIIIFCILWFIFPILFQDSIFSDEFPRWIFELFASMFQSAFILAVIYLVFYVYYRYLYRGVLK